MCACSYEDECLPSKCQDYCKVAVPHADSKKAVCRDNLCHCVAPPTRPPVKKGACTQKACTKACQAAEPNKKVLKASCPEADMCRCSYEDDCTEDICRVYCKKALPNGKLKTSMCINNYCYCNKTEVLLQARCNSHNECDCVYKKDEDAHSVFDFLKVWNSFKQRKERSEMDEDDHSVFDFLKMWYSFVRKLL
ncbi:hypothetical protein MRX96_032522 [Rhipicephalus microplus]